MEPAAESPPDAAALPPFKYWAFISYSHQDNILTRGDGSSGHIQWANWLHEQLETYRIPDGYLDRIICTGEPMPERFFPVFRDEAELPTSHDLGGQIRDALVRSRFLIVIASSRSARSRYVNEEVRYFRQLDRGARILTLIVDGEPNVRLHPKAGWTADDDCFCPALVHPLRPDGTVDTTRLLSEEAIAADVRVKDSDAPREMRATEQDQPDRRVLLEFMKLKLVAGIMGAGLDELVQRDKIRQLGAARLRARVLHRWLAAVATLIALAVIGGAVAWQQWRTARENETVAHANQRRIIAGQKEASRSDTATAQQRLADRKWQEALPYLVRAIRFDPENTNAQEALWLAVCYGKRDRGQMYVHVMAHNDPVWCANYSPDGTRIVTASDDYTAQIWDAITGQPVGHALEHKASVRSAAYSPDGLLIVTASIDNTARIWNAETGESVSDPFLHEDSVLSAEFSRDGTRIVTASIDGTARIWDVKSGRLVGVAMKHANIVNSASFSPDGLRIVTSGDDHTARVWDAQTGLPVGKPLEHKGSVASARFSPDSTRIVTASDDNSARIWNATTGQPVGSPLIHRGAVLNAVYSLDGTLIVTASVDATARLWDSATGQPVDLGRDATAHIEHSQLIYDANFSPDGTRIVTASGDQTVRIWDAKTGEPLGPPMEHDQIVVRAQFSPDGTRVITASFDNTARVWDAATGHIHGVPLQLNAGICSADFSPDGTRIVTVGSGNSGEIWDATTGQLMNSSIRHDGMIWSVRFSPDGTRIVTASEDKTAQLWDANSVRPLGSPMKHQDVVRFANFSPDGTRIVTTSLDEAARIWDGQTGRSLGNPIKQGDSMYRAEFRPGGNSIAFAMADSGDGSHIMRQWDVKSGMPMDIPQESVVNTWYASPSPDGTRVIAKDWSRQISDAISQQPIGPANEQESRLMDASFSKDNTRIVTADEDARVLDAKPIQSIGEDSAEKLVMFVAGVQLDPQLSALKFISIRDRLQLRSELESELEVLSDWQFAAQLYRVSNPETALVSPRMTITIREAVTRLISTQRPGAIREAAGADPGHPLLPFAYAAVGFENDMHETPNPVRVAWLIERGLKGLSSETSAADLRVAARFVAKVVKHLPEHKATAIDLLDRAANLVAEDEEIKKLRESL